MVDIDSPAWRMGRGSRLWCIVRSLQSKAYDLLWCHVDDPGKLVGLYCTAAFVDHDLIVV